MSETLFIACGADVDCARVEIVRMYVTVDLQRSPRPLQEEFDGIFGVVIDVALCHKLPAYLAVGPQELCRLCRTVGPCSTGVFLVEDIVRTAARIRL